MLEAINSAFPHLCYLSPGPCSVPRSIISRACFSVFSSQVFGLAVPYLYTTFRLSFFSFSPQVPIPFLKASSSYQGVTSLVQAPPIHLLVKP